MKNLPNELFKYTQDKNTPYFNFHNYRFNDNEKTNNSLCKFLFSTMDEVRLWFAEDYARAILELTDIDDATHFRKGVLRREVIGEIAYSNQRDHAAHTLYNYLLGWYIISNNTMINNHFINALQNRLGNEDFNHEENWIDNFGCLWPFTSLLHDIGYLLEGVLEATDPSVQSKMVQRGIAVIKDYFTHRYWHEIKMSSIEERYLLKKITLVEEPNFSDYSIAAVADTLRDLGNLRDLVKSVKQKLHDASLTIPDQLNILNSDANDAFNVWIAHYNAYSRNVSITERMKEIQSTFESYLWDGLPTKGIRILDHGVCSGLISLHFSTFFFRMFFAYKDEPEDPRDAIIWKKFKNEGDRNHDYDPNWWWTGIVWGTGAAAIHNIQQQKRPWFPNGKDCGKLTMDEDPLAYLGILVDILQEWDRYAVQRRASIIGSLPLQGIDVKLGISNNIINIDYGEELWARKVKIALDQALSDWDKVVSIQP
jgi:hypothetical protein